MTLTDAATAVEEALRAFISSTTLVAYDGTDPLGDLRADIGDALAHMRFQQPFVSGGVFRNVSFGPTPQMPVGPLWPAYELAFAWLRTGEREPTLYGRERLLALLAALDTLQRQLIYEADCQESIDALNTSRQYLQAAGYVDRAVKAIVTIIQEN